MMSLFSGKVKEIGIISMISIILFSFGLLFYIQNITQTNIKVSLFEQQKQRQIESTKSISEHIGSDLNLVVSMLDGLANSFYLQDDIYSDNTKKLVEEKYNQFTPVINRLFVLDKNDVVTISLAPRRSDIFVGADYSFRDWVKEIRNKSMPVFSDGFERQGIYRIFISFPIIDRQTQELLGIVGTSIPSESFFAHYGNVEHIGSNFLVTYNKGGTILANGISKSLVGQNFFGDYTQRFINHNTILNNLTRNLLAGNSGSAVYDYGQGERLTTQYPVFVNGIPTYFIQVVQPTSQIYSEINNQLFTERAKMFLLLAGTIAVIGVLIIFLIKWNHTLDNEVKRRTSELNESNIQLAGANERLKLHDNVQKEFINIAAHELRTPIQPILSLAQILSNKMKDRTHLELLEIIIKNARRLQKLTEDILDIAKIESQSLSLKKEQLNLDDVVATALEDYKEEIEKTNSKLKLVYKNNEKNNTLVVDADRNRLFQVFNNLLSNAVKFTDEGDICISTENKDTQAMVTVKDSGVGIDPQILPQLFSKFVSKSFKGTGLGLFISKSIVEVHGGKIWAENNFNGEKGATFYFTLPLSKR
ncbi:MAG TPA: sensor histidine kinase [Nitrososphaeraceae archaeon]|nr:sensor histidine kinase [Nitrososphaeraceae archaeon]